MELPGEDWDLNEPETIRSVLRIYRSRLENLEKDDRTRYVSREEYMQVTKALIQFLDASIGQTERLMDCVERTVVAIEKLTDEVLTLRGRIDEKE